MWMVATDSIKPNWVFDTFAEAMAHLTRVRSFGQKATIHKLNYVKEKAWAQ